MQSYKFYCVKFLLSIFFLNAPFTQKFGKITHYYAALGREGGGERESLDDIAGLATAVGIRATSGPPGHQSQGNAYPPPPSQCVLYVNRCIQPQGGRAPPRAGGRGLPVTCESAVARAPRGICLPRGRAAAGCGRIPVSEMVK